jgi:ribosomal protein S1
VHVGERLRVKVLSADRSRRRISLSLKQLDQPVEAVQAHEFTPAYPEEEEEVRVPERERVLAQVAASPQAE